MKRVTPNRVALVGEVARAGLGGVLLLIMALGFGPELYGQYVAAAAIVTLAAPLGTVGFAWWVQPFARAAERAVVGRSSLLVSATGGACACLLTLAVACCTGNRWSAVLAVGMVELAVLPVWSALGTGLLARSELGWYIALAILAPLVKIGGTLLSLLAFGPSLGWWGVCVSAFGVTGLLITVCMLGGFAASVPRTPLRSWFKKGLGFAVVGTAAGATDSVDRIALSWIVDSTALGVYGAAAKLSSFALMPSRAMALVSYPQYFELAARRDTRGIKSLARRTIIRSVLLGAAGGAGTFILAWILQVFVLREYQDLAWIGFFLGIGLLAKPVQFALGDILYAVGRSGVRFWLTVGASLLNLFGVLLLGPRFGPVGAAIGIATAAGVTASLYVPFVRLELRTIDENGMTT